MRTLKFVFVPFSLIPWVSSPGQAKHIARSMPGAAKSVPVTQNEEMRPSPDPSTSQWLDGLHSG